MSPLLRFCSLSSGSCGNVTYISFRGTEILIDAGLSVRKTNVALNYLGTDISEIDALLVTHEHTDHSKSVKTLHNKYNIPVFTSTGTLNSIGFEDYDNINGSSFNAGDQFNIGEIDVETVRLMHDAAEPVGYILNCEGIKISVITDTGCVSKEIFDKIIGSHTVLLEANHDINMLENGRYPRQIKQRIRSNRGHLSNKMAGKLAARLVSKGTKRIILGHISTENNSTQLALQAVRSEMSSISLSEGRDYELDITYKMKAGKIYTEW